MATLIEVPPLGESVTQAILVAWHKADGDPVTRDEAEAAIAAAGHELRPLDIVLVHTGRDAFYHRMDYPSLGCGVTAEATVWLCRYCASLSSSRLCVPSTAAATSWPTAYAKGAKP